MRPFFTALAFALVSLAATAQDTTAQFKIAYFSHGRVLESLGAYAKAKQDIAVLRGKYEEEAKRAENDFNKKYVEFIEGLSDFAPSIRLKRQAELADMVQKNTAFKKEAERLIAQAEDEAMAPVEAAIAEAVREIGGAEGYAIVVNTDFGAAPYTDGRFCTDITLQVAAAAQSKAGR